MARPSTSAQPINRGVEIRLRAVEDLKKVKYDLMRVPYDIEKDAWGAPEPVLTAAQTGMSISEPRASPDGRYLLFCMSAYGGFPVYQPSSDLYLLDLRSGKHRRLECNSDASESWHCWSSNSRWIVFSSKRDNGWLARPYFSYIDAEGREHKPFLLPQKDPAFYDTWLKTYNLPELITGPITTPQEELLRAINSGDAAVDESTQALPRPLKAMRACTNNEPYSPPVTSGGSLSGFQNESWVRGTEGLMAAGVVPSTCPSAYKTFIVCPPPCRARPAPQCPQKYDGFEFVIGGVGYVRSLCAGLTTLATGR